MDVRKVRSGRGRSAMAPPSLSFRKEALAFTPPDASDNDHDDTSATFSSAAPDGDGNGNGNPHGLLTTEVEKPPSSSSLGPASPPSPASSSTITTEKIASSSSSTSGSSPTNGELSGVSAGVDGQDVKKADKVAPELLMWACSAVASSSADDLSKKVAAAVLKALELQAATTAGEGGKEDGRLDTLLWLAKVSVAVLCFLLLMTWVMLLGGLSSDGCGLGRDWSPHPPPT